MAETAYLDSLRSLCRPVRAADFPRSLEPMRALLAALDDPQARFLSVVVAGSVGKGSACWQIGSALWDKSARREGQTVRVGLFTGPHLHSFRERLVINGAMITRDEFVEGARAVTQAAARLPRQFSTFEQAAALALWWFARQGVTTAVLEVGMGGRWDAVNAVRNILAVITPIENEHTAMLGGSLQTIAWHKAGILQPGGYVVSSEQPDVAADILRVEAERAGARLLFAPEVAAAACASLKARHIIRSCSPLPAAPQLPGRLEQIEVGGRAVLIDGAHTAASAARLRDAILRRAGTAPVRVIAGLLGDKAVSGVLSAFDDPRFVIVLTQAPGHRALAPEALRQQAQLRHAAVEIVPGLADALAQAHTAPESLVVVTGSLRMAAAAREALGLLPPDELEEARATRAIFEGEQYLRRLV